MSDQRRGGIIQLQIGGVLQDAAGNYSYGLGNPKRKVIMGSGKPNGFSEEPQVAYIEGEITDRGDYDLKALTDTVDTTVTLALANGKVVVLRDAWFAGDGDAETGEGKIKVRFESSSPGEEIS